MSTNGPVLHVQENHDINVRERILLQFSVKFNGGWSELHDEEVYPETINGIWMDLEVSGFDCCSYSDGSCAAEEQLRVSFYIVSTGKDGKAPFFEACKVSVRCDAWNYRSAEHAARHSCHALRLHLWQNKISAQSVHPMLVPCLVLQLPPPRESEEEH